MHHFHSWIKRDQLDVTCFFISLFNVQHVSDVNTFILRSLRLTCWVISWVVLFWYDACWCYVAVWLGWCGIRMQASACKQAVSKSVWHIPLLCVQWKTPGGGQRNCPKRVEFESKNKFEKLGHLVGFIRRIYHDVRSRERQNNGHLDPTRRLTLVSAASKGRSLLCLQHTSIIKPNNMTTWCRSYSNASKV